MKTIDGVLTLTLEGRLDTSNALQTEQRLMSELDGEDFADAERLVEREVGELGHFFVRSRFNLFPWWEGDVKNAWCGLF